MADPTLTTHIAARNAQLTDENPVSAEHYLPVLQERADTYAAHIATMALPPDVTYWAMAMTRKYGGSYVRAHHFIADWVTALLIAMYGEEPDGSKTQDGLSWPTALSAGDLVYAQAWLAGSKWPEGFRYFKPKE